VRAYASVVQARFRMLLQYRAAALAGFGTQLFWGLIRVMIFDAFYRSSSAAQPMSYSETVTYLWLIQAMLLLLPWTIDAEIRAMVRDGSLAYELARPTDLYWFWYCRNLATRTAPVLLRATPLFVAAGLFFGMAPPPNLGAAAAWLLTTLGAIVLGSAISTLMSISLLWTIAGDGVARLVATLATMLSGSVIPLPLFPDWSQPILNALPFRGLMDVPFRFYLGHLPLSRLLPELGLQLAWTAALVGLGRLILARGARRLVVQGG